MLCLTFLRTPAARPRTRSGFAAVYVAALVLGNAELPHRAATRSFAEGVAWLAQIGLFVMLGLLLSPGRITLEIVGLARRGRPGPDLRRPAALGAGERRRAAGCRWRELAFISWAGLRGAVPIVLTTIPLAEGVDGAERLFDIVFVMVVIYTLLTGPTLPLVARVLKVARRSEPRDLDVEAAPLERIAADLLQVTISPVSQMHGVEVGELRLPRGCVGVAGHPRGRDAGARAPHRPAPRRRPAGRHPAQAAGGDRGAAAPGVARRPARPVARTTRRRGSSSARARRAADRRRRPRRRSTCAPVDQLRRTRRRRRR